VHRNVLWRGFDSGDAIRLLQQPAPPGKIPESASRFFPTGQTTVLLNNTSALLARVTPWDLEINGF